MSVHDGEDSSSSSLRMSSISRKSRSRSYDADRSRSRSRGRSRQRDVGKKSWTVFVRNLHESVTEEDLRKHFAACGHVVDASVVRDRKNDRLKGYGFIAFETEDGQRRATQTKNGTSFFNKNIVVQVSTRKTTIYVGNLPYDFSTEQDAADLQRAVEDRCGKRILSTRLKGRYAFCEFNNFEHTQCALQKLPGLIFQGGELRVQLANSTRAEEDVMSKENLKRTLFIRNVSTDVSERHLRQHFKVFGEMTRCEIIRDRAGEQREYGFIAFRDRYATDQAYREMHKKMIGGKEITVEYAKSKEYSKERVRSRRQERSRSRESSRTSRRRESDSGRRHVSRLEIDDVLARGWPLLAYDTTVGRMVLLSSDSKKTGRHGRERDRGSRSRRYD